MHLSFMGILSRFAEKVKIRNQIILLSGKLPLRANFILLISYLYLSNPSKNSCFFPQRMVYLKKAFFSTVEKRCYFLR